MVHIEQITKERRIYGRKTSDSDVEICSIKDTEFELYYALPEWERPSHRSFMPYMFFGNVVNYCRQMHPSFMPDGNHIYKVSFNGLH